MDNKSYVEFILGALQAQLSDCAFEYPSIAFEFRRDLSRLRSAIDCHGIRFALDIMPQFRKHFDQCLDTGRLVPSNLCHFGTSKKGGPIPKLLRGLVLRVFDSYGNIRNDPDINAIRDIRQILGSVRKLRIASPPEAQHAAVDEYVRIESAIVPSTLDWENEDDFTDERIARLSLEDRRLNVHRGELDLSSHDAPATLSASVLHHYQLCADIVCSTLGVYQPLEWQFRQGPGAVADQPYGEYRYSFKHWSDRLETVFPYDQFATANWSILADELAVDDIAHEERPAKLCCVPKTLTKPRLIASEPVSHQWAQQSIREFMYSRASRTWVGDFVSYKDQTLNGRLALKASMDRHCATIDLSSASDRLSCWVVERLFRRSPHLLRAMRASRSVYLRQDIDRKSPKLIRLRKYASMGNATTFPVQSMSFLILALGATLLVRNKRASIKNMQRYGKDVVRVFGDDIIVPNDVFGLLTEHLEAFGLKVNTAKTFSGMTFRESCGVDAFAGHDVTSVSILDLPEEHRPGSIVSSVQVHHNLLERGLFRTAEWLRRTVESPNLAIPVVKHGSGLFGWSDADPTVSPYPCRTRWNTSTHVLERRCLMLVAKADRRQPNCSAGLLQYFTEAVQQVTSSVSTLGWLGRRPKSHLRLRWVG